MQVDFTNAIAFAFNGKITVRYIAHSVRYKYYVTVDILQNMFGKGNNIIYYGSSFYYTAQNVRYI